MVDLEKALIHLRQDAVMAELIEKFPVPLRAEAEVTDVFVDLVESIISQQLLVRVADVIMARIYNLVPKHQLTPESILAVDPEALRACGVSYAKIKYIRSAADAALSGLVNFAGLKTKNDEEVVAELIQIVGVGQWTAEMLLMFSLQRPDVFSVGDLGLRTAIFKLYGIERENRVAMLELSERWSPYRTLASRYLWANLENTPKINDAG